MERGIVPTLMKRLLRSFLILLVAFSFWSCTKKTEPAAGGESTQPIAESKLTIKDVDVITANKSLAQWKSFIPELHYSTTIGKIEYWEQRNRDQTTGIPLRFTRNDRAAIFNVSFAGISAYKPNGILQVAELHSPKMDINETKKLGLQLLQLVDLDPKDFLAWCETAAAHGMDEPVFSTGTRDHLYIINTRHSFNEAKPWYILFEIQNPDVLHLY